MTREICRRPDMFASCSGASLYVLDPWGSDIRLTDIALQLARVNRYGGMYLSSILTGYSVAQHSVWVSYKCAPEDALRGLFHDAAEAYLGDMIGPVKGCVGRAYKDIEDSWLQAIGERFGLPDLDVKPPSVQVADRLSQDQERADLLPRGQVWRQWGAFVKPYPRETIIPMTEEQAGQAWLKRYWELTE